MFPGCGQELSSFPKDTVTVQHISFLRGLTSDLWVMGLSVMCFHTCAKCITQRAASRKYTL